MNSIVMLATLSSSEIIQIVWAAALVCCVAFGSFAVVGSVAMYRTGTGAAKSFGLILLRAAPMLAIAMLVLAIFVLSLLNLVSGEAALAALSGIGGAVLGNFASQGAGEARQAEK